ncbi:hypothetical protein AAG906_016023 [Vitis piasezkii]
MGEAIAVVMFFPSQCVEYRGFKKVVFEEDKPVSVPLRRSFASVVVGEGSRKQGIEPFRRWDKVMVYEFLEASKVVGIKGVISITPFFENQGIFFVESTDIANYLHEKRIILVSEKIEVKLQEDRKVDMVPCLRPHEGHWE